MIYFMGNILIGRPMKCPKIRLPKVDDKLINLHNVMKNEPNVSHAETDVMEVKLCKLNLSN